MTTIGDWSTIAACLSRTHDHAAALEDVSRMTVSTIEQLL